MQVSGGNGALSARLGQIVPCCLRPIEQVTKPLRCLILQVSLCAAGEEKGELPEDVSGFVGTDCLKAGEGITSGYLAFSILRGKWSQKMEEGEYLLPNGCD